MGVSAWKRQLSFQEKDVQELMHDVEMTNGHHSPQMRHSDLTQPYTNSNGNQHEAETKPTVITLPEEIFGLAGDLTRWELRGDSFHRPRPFNFNPASVPQQSTFNPTNGTNSGLPQSNNDSFFSNIEVQNVFQLNERPSKFAFDNRRSGEIDSMMTDSNTPYMGAGSHFNINNNHNSMYQNQQRSLHSKHDDLDHFSSGPHHHHNQEDMFFKEGSFGPHSYPKTPKPPEESAEN